MDKMEAKARLVQYGPDGVDTANPIKLVARLCPRESPAMFDIVLPQEKGKPSRAIHITRAEIERVLAANPKK